MEMGLWDRIWAFSTGWLNLGDKLSGILKGALERMVTEGLPNTLLLTIISFSIALVIATLIAFVQYANISVLKQISRFYIWIIRGTPLLVQLVVIFYALPAVGIIIDAFPSAIIAFSLNEGAYGAETMRAAIDSVPAGQMEAGLCVGMSRGRTMLRIVLPQALRTATPNLFNSLIAMVKDTSLVATISVMEIFMIAKQIGGRYYEYLAVYVLVALVYLVVCTVLTLLQRLVERLLNKRVGREVKAHA